MCRIKEFGQTYSVSPEICNFAFTICCLCVIMCCLLDRPMSGGLEEKPSNVLFFTVYNPKYPITVVGIFHCNDGVCHNVCGAYCSYVCSCLLCYVI